MDVEDRHKLKWKHCSGNMKSNLHNLFTRNTLTDVTLVSDEKIPFMAHKLVLGACSPILRDILISNPNTNPIIYLKGFQKADILSLLNFIYYGEIQLHQSRIAKFLDIGEDLQIKDITRFLTKIKTNLNEDDDLDDHNRQISDIVTESENIEDKSYMINNERDMEAEKHDFDHQYDNVKDVFLCDKCKTKFRHKSSLNKHIRSKHEGIRYFCDSCDYQVPFKCDLKNHMDVVHKGIRYSCNNCEYASTSERNLKKHIEIIHEGLRYACDSCDYKTTVKSSLKTHKKSIHEGVRYECHRCDYKATTLSSLKRHTDSIHESVGHLCHSCNYRATQLYSLKRHIEGVHEGVKFYCDHCQYKTGFKRLLTRHNQIHHSSSC